jgi:CRISPR/Cas system-associated exonuclease Cas4 (RecB family)
MKKIISTMIILLLSTQTKAACEYSKNWYATYSNEYICSEFHMWNNGRIIHSIATCPVSNESKTKPIGTNFPDNTVTGFTYNNRKIWFKSVGQKATIYANSDNHEAKYKTETRYEICF